MRSSTWLPKNRSIDVWPCTASASAVEPSPACSSDGRSIGTYEPPTTSSWPPRPAARSVAAPPAAPASTRATALQLSSVSGDGASVTGTPGWTASSATWRPIVPAGSSAAATVAFTEPSTFRPGVVRSVHTHATPSLFVNAAGCPSAPTPTATR